jgi:hypothetical protein
MRTNVYTQSFLTFIYWNYVGGSVERSVQREHGRDGGGQGHRNVQVTAQNVFFPGILTNCACGWMYVHIVLS